MSICPWNFPVMIGVGKMVVPACAGTQGLGGRRPYWLGRSGPGAVCAGRASRPSAGLAGKGEYIGVHGL